MDESKSPRPTWKSGDTIRNKVTGHPYTVIHVYKEVFTELIDLEVKDSLVQPLILKSAHYDEYANDVHMDYIKQQWKYNPINMYL